MLPEPLPSTFILQKSRWSLPELRWAFERGLIGAQSLVDAAAWMLADGNETETVLRLAILTHAELAEAANAISDVPIDEGAVNTIRRKWLWLILSWIHDHHREDDHVWDILDGLYADFGYPSEMASFGPYAPAYQSKQSPGEVRGRVLEEWERYLRIGDAEFGASV